MGLIPDQEPIGLADAPGESASWHQTPCPFFKEGPRRQEEAVAGIRIALQFFRTGKGACQSISSTAGLERGWKEMATVHQNRQAWARGEQAMRQGWQVMR
jgi:hypothetical protein